MTTSILDDLFSAQGGGDFLDVGGRYEFEVTKAEAKPSSTGKPGLKINMKVANGPFEGKQLVHQLYFSPESEAAKNILWRSLQALGITQEQMKASGEKNKKEGEAFLATVGAAGVAGDPPG